MRVRDSSPESALWAPVTWSPQLAPRDRGAVVFSLFPPASSPGRPPSRQDGSSRGPGQMDLSACGGQPPAAPGGHGKQRLTLALILDIKIESTFLYSDSSVNNGLFLSGFGFYCAPQLTPAGFSLNLFWWVLLSFLFFNFFVTVLFFVCLLGFLLRILSPHFTVVSVHSPRIWHRSISLPIQYHFSPYKGLFS